MITLNAAQKLKTANWLTAIVAMLAVIQTNLTHPPYASETVFLWTGVITYATLVATAFKQALSPEVSNLGWKVTIGIAAAATLTGIIDLLPHLHIPDVIGQKIKLWVNIAVTVINIMSKQIFPSDDQKDKIHELKRQL